MDCLVWVINQIKRISAPGGSILHPGAGTEGPVVDKRQPRRAAARKAVAQYKEKYRAEIERTEEIWKTPGDEQPLPNYFRGDDVPPGFYESLRPSSSLEREIYILLDHLTRSALIRDPAVFSYYLQEWFHRQSISTPTGVFSINFFSRGPGRPRKDMEKLVAILKYMEHGKFARAARAFDPEAYEKNPKAATDRIRQLINSLESGATDEESAQ
jgi:hypothetical protein